MIYCTIKKKRCLVRLLLDHLKKFFESFWSSKYQIRIIFVDYFRSLIYSFFQWNVEYKRLISNGTQISVFSDWSFFSFLTNSKLVFIIQWHFKYSLNFIFSHLHEAYFDVFITDRTGLSGQLVLWFLAKLYTFQGLVPLDTSL